LEAEAIGVEAEAVDETATSTSLLARLLGLFGVPRDLASDKTLAFASPRYARDKTRY